MQIAIIGSGNVGRALASSMTKAGHDVTLSATDEAHAREAAAQTGATAASSNEDAVSTADVVVHGLRQQREGRGEEDGAEHERQQVGDELRQAIGRKILARDEYRRGFRRQAKAPADCGTLRPALWSQPPVIRHQVPSVPSPSPA